jgi:hypothetical protein
LALKERERDGCWLLCIELDGRLSSDGGYAQRREQAASNIQTSSSQGSVQPRLEGRDCAHLGDHRSKRWALGNRRRRSGGSEAGSSAGARAEEAGVQLGEEEVGAVLGGLNNSGSFAVHARAPPFKAASPSCRAAAWWSSSAGGFGLLHGRPTDPSLSPLLLLLPFPFTSSYLWWWPRRIGEKIPQGRHGSGRGRRTGFIGRRNLELQVLVKD